MGKSSGNYASKSKQGVKLTDFQTLHMHHNLTYYIDQLCIIPHCYPTFNSKMTTLKQLRRLVRGSRGLQKKGALQQKNIAPSIFQATWMGLKHKLLAIEMLIGTDKQTNSKLFWPGLYTCTAKYFYPIPLHCVDRIWIDRKPSFKWDLYQSKYGIIIQR